MYSKTYLVQGNQFTLAKGEPEIITLMENTDGDDNEELTEIMKKLLIGPVDQIDYRKFVPRQFMEIAMDYLAQLDLIQANYLRNKFGLSKDDSYLTVN